MAAPAPKRGGVYWLDFSSETGSEMAGKHPCLVVQNDVGNKHSNLTIVAAITSNLRAAKLPVAVLVPAGTGGIPKESIVHCGHRYTIDKQRLAAKIGSLPRDLMKKIDL